MKGERNAEDKRCDNREKNGEEREMWIRCFGALKKTESVMEQKMGVNGCY